MRECTHIKEIQFVNGLKPGQIDAPPSTAKPVGSIIFNDAEVGR